MNNSPQHPATGAPPEAVSASLEAIIDQARHTRQHHLDDIVRRLGRGERPRAEQIYDALCAQTLCTWWLLVARHIEHAEGGRLRPAHAVARFVSWITPYLGDPTPFDSGIAQRALGLSSEHELALAHLDRSLALIRQGAARIFLTQAETLAPARSAEQSSSASTGQEATA
ncbi:hypothetical protein AB0M95_36605 [Sphaerisporangium sp. NPDC051017]|uniref:hypothetical protein n=1 Tax=Sphaerisporangium sp. NPDC051017 TaxID=3154636 RepID=UPI003430B612